MSIVHLFNPENDLALALGKNNFTAPAAAMALHYAGALLPMWWSQPGDLILASKDYEADGEFMKQTFGLYGDIADSDTIKSVCEARPWGWSHNAARQFIVAGTPKRCIPADETIDAIRQLSHRRLTRQVLEKLDVSEDRLPIVFQNPVKALDYAVLHPDSFIKQPWSSSGRGVFHTARLSRPQVENFITGIIRHQGSVVIEPAYNKIKDFAALFHCNKGSLTFKALSAFSTDAHNSYSGNFIMSDSDIISWLGIDPTPVIEQLQTALDPIMLPEYSGWIGVDMLTYASASAPTSISIAPCIEINVRTTMGVVAYFIREKLGIKNGRVTFSVSRRPPLPESIHILPPRNGFNFTISKIL